MKESPPTRTGRVEGAYATRAQEGARSRRPGPKRTGPRRGGAGAPAALLEEYSRDDQLREVAFTFFDPAATHVALAGTFNDWQPIANPMARRPDGTWSTSLLLRPGRYEYRLVVDGKWHDDPMAARFVANSFGGLNGVIEVANLEA